MKRRPIQLERDSFYKEWTEQRRDNFEHNTSKRKRDISIENACTYMILCWIGLSVRWG